MGGLDPGRGTEQGVETWEQPRQPRCHEPDFPGAGGYLGLSIAATELPGGSVLFEKN